MACKCPVCKKSTSTVGALVEHVTSSQDNPHQEWLESYCGKNKLDYGRILLQQLNGDKNANKPLTAPLTRDFCKG